MRKVILHYHLFKNAGSSVDGLLSKSFGDKWMSFDPKNPSGKINADNLSVIIENNPDIKAFSSHCIVPPLPQGDFEVFPIVILRDPIARVLSAYSFEWKKQLGLDKAKGSLSEYIQDKFSKPRANAIEDFQTFRLAVNETNRCSPINNVHDEVVLSQAQEFISSIPVFGLVEDFDTSLKLFKQSFGEYFPEMIFENLAKNVTQDTAVPIYARHEKIKTAVGTDTYEELVKRNLLDIKLYAYAKGIFDEKSKTLKTEENENYENITLKIATN